MERGRVYEKIRERISFFSGDLFLELLLILLIILGGYRYIFLPYERVLSIEENIVRERDRIKLYGSRLEKLEKKELEIMEIGKVEKEGKYFSKVQEFKEGIDSILKEKDLMIVEVASGEKEGERIYYSYHIQGNEVDMMSFLREIEGRDEAFTLVNAPIKMERENLTVKIGGYFRFHEELKREKNIAEREEVFSRGEIENEFYPLGKDRGIVILKGKDRRPKRVIVERELEVEYYGERYKLEIRNGGLRIE